MAEHYGFPSVTAMELALGQARAAMERGEVPVGAVVVSAGGEILAADGNRMVALGDPSAHAEMLAIRAACRRLGAGRLVGCDLHVTLEPCAMCAGVISFARIARLCYGAGDPKGGAVVHGARFFSLPTCHHAPQVSGGVAARECGDLLREFFQARRRRNNQAATPSGRQA